MNWNVKNLSTDLMLCKTLYWLWTRHKHLFVQQYGVLYEKRADDILPILWMWIDNDNANDNE